MTLVGRDFRPVELAPLTRPAGQLLGIGGRLRIERFHAVATGGERNFFVRDVVAIERLQRPFMAEVNLTLHGAHRTVPGQEHETVRPPLRRFDANRDHTKTITRRPRKRFAILWLAENGEWNLELESERLGFRGWRRAGRGPTLHLEPVVWEFVTPPPLPSRARRPWRR